MRGLRPGARSAAEDRAVPPEDAHSPAQKANPAGAAAAGASSFPHLFHCTTDQSFI